MAMREFVASLIEGLLSDKSLKLTEDNIRFYDAGTCAENDASMDIYVKWENAKQYNCDSNVVRSSILIIQWPMRFGAEYISFPMGNLYRDSRKHGVDVVLANISSILKKHMVNADLADRLREQIKNLDAIRDKLVLRPFNYDDNDKILSNAVYRRVGDIAIVLYARFEMGEAQKWGLMISKDMVQDWGENEDELLDKAMENTMKLQPPILNRFCGISSMPWNQIRFMEDTVVCDFSSYLTPTLSTDHETNGAIAAFYPGVLDRLCEMIGQDFYLVFTSIHEVHVYAANGLVTVDNMRKSLAGTNKHANRREAILSRQVYRYDGKAKKLTVAD